MKFNMSDNDLKKIAATVHGEMRGQSDDAKLQVASSIFNRLGRHEWANKSLDEVLHGGYYAVSHPDKNKGFTEAMSGKFPDKESENDYKRTYAQVGAMNRGNIDPTDAQFYFKQPEINKLAKSGGFDFSKVEEGKGFGKFRTFHYKDSDSNIPAVTTGVEGGAVRQ